MRVLGAASGLLAAVAVVLLVVPVHVRVAGRSVSCGSVTLARRFGPTVSDPTTKVPAQVAAAAGQCDTAVAGRTAAAVPLGLLAVLGLLGVGIASGVLDVDPQPPGPSPPRSQDGPPALTAAGTPLPRPR